MRRLSLGRRLLAPVVILWATLGALFGIRSRRARLLRALSTSERDRCLIRSVRGI